MIDAESRIAELEAELASYENPTCNGEWVGGSGGHRKFSGCGLPATWRDDGGACFCDHHLPQNERIAQLESELSETHERVKLTIGQLNAKIDSLLGLIDKRNVMVADLECDLATDRAAMGPLGTPPLPNDPRLP